MAVFNFSALADGQAISFDPDADVLSFDETAIAAADIRVSVVGSDVAVTYLSSGKTVTLLEVSPFQLATSNVTFADGSRLLFGDDSTALNDNLANTLEGTAGRDHLNGFGGADTMSGGAGDDIYFVTSGDVISDSGGIDTIFAEASFAIPSPIENITFTGSANTASAGNWLPNAMTGNSGANYLDGRGDNDTLAGAGGNDTLVGGPGADVFAFAEAGSAHADSITDFASGVDKIRLDASYFSAIGAEGDFTAGDGRFVAGAGLSSGQDADDRVIYNTTTGELWYDADGSGSGAAQLVATLQGAPALSATDITIVNGSGGEPGGGVHLVGTSGNDSLVGGDGDDTLEGLAGNDTLVGGEGDDLLDGGADADTMDGGPGNDTYVVTSGDVLSDSGGLDTVVSGVSWSLGAGFENLVLTGTAGSSGFGNSLDNRIEGNAGANYIQANSGRDTVVGGAGNDTIGGNSDEDWLEGGAGNDSVAGGGGQDSFVFREAGAANADFLPDYATGWDRIMLDAGAFAEIGAQGQFASGDGRFHSAPGASSGQDADDRVIFNSSTGQLFYDPDGSGAAQSQLIATMGSGRTVAAQDLWVFGEAALAASAGAEGGGESLAGKAGEIN